MTQQEKFMKQALKEAKKAFEKEEVPIGAIIVKDGKVISRAFNKRELNNVATSHAEILAIEKACKKLNSWRLNDCDIYVTLEPCPMCAGAILNSRIRKLYFGALDEKSGAIVSNAKLLDLDGNFCNHKVEYDGEVLKDECQGIIKEFFGSLRKK